MDAKEEGWKPDVEALNAEQAKMKLAQEYTLISVNPKFQLYLAALKGISTNPKIFDSDVASRAYNIAEQAYELYLKKNPSQGT